MTLSPGMLLGVYEIKEQIGAGGMGEVYRAHDTKLGRDVAIKVLPAALARDPERLARFEREARVLAALNHPNIAQIYGLEDRAIVMEMVEGPTLADRLKAGPMPLKTALPIAIAIAEALEAAHERGIVHRDLKPANVKAPLDGPVKVLDLGLATALPGDPAESGRGENSPTLTMGATTAGVIMGTAAYMSPEQASGKRVDKRADIWSFGVVLWEMLTGSRLFDGGETVSHTLADVLRKEIDFSNFPAPEPIRQLVKRCLDRNEKTRLRDIGEARITLTNYSPDVEQVILPPAVPGRASKLAWAVAAVLALTAAALAFTHFREIPPAVRSVRFQIPNPDNVRMNEFALSPDGRYLAFINDFNGRMLWVRALDTLEAHPLPGTEGAIYPFWSPDSGFIGFFGNPGKLKKVAVAGGPPVSLCDVGAARGGAWGPDGVILYSDGGELLHVGAGGGVPAKVPLPNSAGVILYPEFLPDGHFLYTAAPRGIFAGSLKGEEVPILPDQSSVTYQPPSAKGQPGHILFLRQQTLMALPFDADRLRAVGDVFPVADQVGQTRGNTSAFSASKNGVLAYGTGQFGEGRELVWLDRTGKRLHAATKAFQICCNQPVLSRDETRVAVPVNNIGGGGVDTWIADLVRGTSGRFTFFGTAGSAAWSPDGSQLAFGPRKGATGQIFVKPANGASKEVLLAEVGPNLNVWDWSSDGKFLVYQTRGAKSGTDLWLLPLEGDHKPLVYLQAQFDETQAAFSPDGKWMAYQSNESGLAQIWVQSIPAGTARYQISTAGGAWPVWRRDGKELFYLESTKLIAVPMKISATTVEAGKPETLFDGVETRFQTSRDGKKFLVSVPAEGKANTTPPVTILTNWQAALGK